MQFVKLSTNCLPESEAQATVWLLFENHPGVPSRLLGCTCRTRLLDTALHVYMSSAYSLLGASFAYRGHPSRVLGVFSSLALAMEAPVSGEGIWEERTSDL